MLDVSNNVSNSGVSRFRTLSLTFFIVQMVTFAMLIGFLHVQKRAQFKGAVEAVTGMRGYQGLVLDISGSASLLIGIVEKTENIYVRHIEFRRRDGTEQKLSRDFFPSGSNFPDLIISRIEASTEVAEYKIAILGILPVQEVIFCLLFSVFLGLLAILSQRFAVSLQRRRQEMLATVRTNELVLQIVHDIRSPLFALEMVSTQIDKFPEDIRTIIRSSVNRIHDIANSLSVREKASLILTAKSSP